MLHSAFNDARRRFREATRADLGVESWTEAVFDRSALAMLFVSADGVVRRINRALATLLRRGPDVVGRPWTDVVGGDAADASDPVLRTILGGAIDYAEVERPVLRGDGSRAIVRLGGGPLRDAGGEVAGALAIVVDASEAIDLAEALRQAEERFQAAFEGAPYGMAIVTPEGRIVSANRAYGDMLRCAPEELFGRSVAEVLGEEDQDEALRHIAAADRGKGLRTWKVRRRDGTSAWLEGRSAPIHDADGRVRWIVGHCLDVSERVLAERALGDVERRMEALFDEAPSAMVLCDVHGDVLRVNRAAAGLLGRPPGDVLGRSVFDVLSSPGSSPWFSSALDRDGAARSYLVDVRRPDGTAVTVEARTRAIAGEGGATWVIVDTRDVTERLAAERALSESEERFRTAFDQAPFGMSITTLDGQFLRVNAAYCRMLGRREDEIVGRSYTELTAPEDVERVVAERHRLGTQPIVRLEKRYVHAEGHHVWAEVTNAVLYSADGVPRYVIGLVRDIDEQRRQQAERERLEERLRRSQRHETVARLAGGIAHEYNNMLAVILNFAHFAARRPAGDNRLRSDLEHIQSAALRCAELTKQLMIYGRRDAEAPAPVTVNAAVERIATLLAGGLDDPDRVRVRFDLDPAAGIVLLPPSRLEQMLTHLLVNAHEAMADGGEVTVRTRRTAAPAGVSGGAFVQIVVEDTGHGMAPEVAALAFEPFFTTKEVGRGTGLGLTIVQGVVDAAGGTVSLDTAEGRGTRVTVHLPTAPGDEDDTPTPDVDRRGEETVLVVDDEPLLLELMVRVLGDAGFRAVGARSPDEALTMARGRTGYLDLVIADVVMPGLPGPKLVAAIRETHPEARVLFVSGYAEDRVARHEVPPGTWSFLPKPFDPGDLLRAVRDVLGPSVRARS